MSPEDRIRAMDLWSGPVTIAPLSGGITNLNFVVTDAGRHFVVRLGQDIPEHLVMRWNERALTEAAAAAGISPALRHAEPGLMVTDFVASQALAEADLHDSATLHDAVALVGRVHRELSQQVAGPVLTFWVFHVLRTYAAWLEENGSAHIARLPGLTICALNGTLAGGAMGMALACDLRIAVEGAKFFYPVMKLGFLPQPSDPARLTALVGPSRAKMILMAGQKIPADEALQWGLIDRIVAPDALMTEARALAADSLGQTPEHSRAIKALIR